MTTHTNPTVWHLTVIGPSGETVLVDWLFSDFERAADAAIQQIDKILHLSGSDAPELFQGETLLRDSGFVFDNDTGWLWVNSHDIGDDSVTLKEREVL